MSDYKKLFKDARSTLNEREKDEPVLKKDWNVSWPEHQRVQRVKNRQRLLKKLNPTSRCPLCEEVKLNSRQWIILKECATKVIEHRVICKSCYMKWRKGSLKQ